MKEIDALQFLGKILLCLPISTLRLFVTYSPVPDRLPFPKQVFQAPLTVLSHNHQSFWEKANPVYI